jgi:hypothetical protein
MSLKKLINAAASPQLMEDKLRVLAIIRQINDLFYDPEKLAYQRTSKPKLTAEGIKKYATEQGLIRHGNAVNKAIKALTASGLTEHQKAKAMNESGSIVRIKHTSSQFIALTQKGDKTLEEFDQSLKKLATIAVYLKSSPLPKP